MSGRINFVMAAWAALNVFLFWSMPPVAVLNAWACGLLLGMGADR